MIRSFSRRGEDSGKSLFYREKFTFGLQIGIYIRRILRYNIRCMGIVVSLSLRAQRTMLYLKF